MRRNLNHILVAIGLDVAALVVAVFASSWIRIALPFGRYLPEVTQEVPLLLEALAIYPLVFMLLSLYDPDRSMQEWDEVLALVSACAMAGLALAGLIYFSIREVSRLLLVYFFGIHFLLVSGWRFLLHWQHQGAALRHVRRVLLVGDGNLARQVAVKLEERLRNDIELVGYLGNAVESDARLAGLPYLGSLENPLKVVHDQKIEDVLIALDGESQAAARQVVISLVETSCNLWLAPNFYTLLVYGGQVQSWGGLSLISLKAPALTGYQRLLKRMFDLFFGAILFVISIPLMISIAFVIRLDSAGAPLLQQERVGENRRLFKMYKFRTMVSGLEKKASDRLRIDSNEDQLHKFPDDPRVTRVGKFLRRTSLDELPQLWNVLKGEMSLVGPRPELPWLVARYETWQQQRFSVPQGITGWWQVNGRSDRPMHLHTEDDLFYIQHYSLWLDVQILLKTVWVVLRGKGAY